MARFAADAESSSGSASTAAASCGPRRARSIGCGRASDGRRRRCATPEEANGCQARTGGASRDVARRARGRDRGSLRARWIHGPWTSAIASSSGARSPASRRCSTGSPSARSRRGGALARLRGGVDGRSASSDRGPTAALKAAERVRRDTHQFTGHRGSRRSTTCTCRRCVCRRWRSRPARSARRWSPLPPVAGRAASAPPHPRVRLRDRSPSPRCAPTRPSHVG